MNRRALLANAAAAASVGSTTVTAGCLEPVDGEDPRTGDQTNATAATTTTSCATAETPDANVESAADGFHVQVSVSLYATESEERADGTATTLVASLPYDAWYHVTETRIERGPGSGADPPSDGWATVACA
jgi:hypothetical protein